MIVEKLVLNYLLGADLSVGDSVYLETPVDPEDEYILIEKIGGNSSNKIGLSRIDIKACSKISLERVMDINEEVLEAMETFGEQADGIFGCDLNYNNNFTNSASKLYRYQAGFNIYY